MEVFESSQFPKLYKESRTGKLQHWLLAVEGDNIVRADGYVDGKTKDISRKICAGNSRRSGEEQALTEAEALWIRQLDKGYAPRDEAGKKIFDFVMDQKSRNGNLNRGVKMFGESKIKTDSTAGKIDLNTLHSPMLADQYLENYSKVSEWFEENERGVIIQAKVDGIRCLASLNPDGTVRMETRNGREFVFLEELKSELKQILKPGLVLDGELYVHELFEKDSVYTRESGDRVTNVERYQFITQICRTTSNKPREFETLAEYWIFDIFEENVSFEKRFGKVKRLIRSAESKGLSRIREVPTKYVKSQDQIELAHQKYIDLTFEGVMIRNPKSHYSVDKRTSNLLKYKRFYDEEWVVVDAEPCKGTQAGACTWILEKDGLRVKAKQTGDLETSRKLYRERNKHVGRRITIRFNERTKKGVPRFPRAIAFRDFE